MNVASLELCKKLPIEWNDTSYIWVVTSNGASVWRNDGQWEINGIDVFPAPDLGYLLRKLPEQTSIYKWNGSQYKAHWFHTSNRFTTEYAFSEDTPEDAAAKLRIELIKQGLLK